ncbi:MAG: lytic transglycosylase domain-containing protein [Verrucomicrobiota bacterium]
MRFFVFLALVAALAGVSLWWKTEHDRAVRYDQYIAEAAAKYDIHPELIRAVIWKESAFDERAVGLAQERGLMQVTPVAGQEWAKAQKIADFEPDLLFQPRTNIHAGAWYLGRALDRWYQADEPEVFALAEYNAGRSQALRWAKDLHPPTAVAFHARIDYPSTKIYVTDIINRYQLYRTQSHPGPFGTLWERALRKWQNWHDRKK